MSDRTYHDVKGLLRRLEIMADMLHEGEFTAFPEEEVRRDMETTVDQLLTLMRQLGQ
jgi:hypothetical protein